MNPNELDVVLDRDELEAVVGNLAETIQADYQDRDRVVCVGVLNGAFVFLSDLIRQLDLPIVVDFVRVSSYRDQQTSPEGIRFDLDLSTSIQDRHVLLVEDIVDTGKTLSYLLEMMKSRYPESIRVCTLLQKPDRTEHEIPIDYLGKKIPPQFVVGYGLDYNNKYRHLPYIAVLEE